MVLLCLPISPPLLQAQGVWHRHLIVYNYTVVGTRGYSKDFGRFGASTVSPLNKRPPLKQTLCSEPFHRLGWGGNVWGR